MTEPRGRLGRSRLGVILFVAALLLAPALPAEAVPVPSPGVTVGTVSATFYSSSSTGLPTSLPPASELWTQTFPNLTFDPPSSYLSNFPGGTPGLLTSCTTWVTSSGAVTATGVDSYTDPLTNVLPEPGGVCREDPAQGNGHQAGSAGTSFNAALTGWLTVSGPGPVTFNASVMGGWALGIGSATNGTPAPTPSGLLPASLSKTILKGYTVMGGSETSLITPTVAYANFTVTFNGPGTYPFEFDAGVTPNDMLPMTLEVKDAVIPQTSTPSTGPPPVPPLVYVGPFTPPPSSHFIKNVTGTVGVPFFIVLKKKGGVDPVTWHQTGGTVPPGLSLQGSGALIGTPTKAGTYVFTVNVVDKKGDVATGKVTATIYPVCNGSPPPAVTNIVSELTGIFDAKVSWAPVKGVSQYQVIHTNAQGTYSTLPMIVDGTEGQTPTTVFGTDHTFSAIFRTGPSVYHFEVRSCLACGCSAPSAVDTIRYPGPGGS